MIKIKRGVSGSADKIGISNMLCDRLVSHGSPRLLMNGVGPFSIPQRNRDVNACWEDQRAPLRPFKALGLGSQRLPVVSGYLLLS